MEDVVVELRRMADQLEKYNKLTFDSVIVLYNILEKLDPKRIYDPKSPENKNLN